MSDAKKETVVEKYNRLVEFSKGLGLSNLKPSDLLEPNEVNEYRLIAANEILKAKREFKKSNDAASSDNAEVLKAREAANLKWRTLVEKRKKTYDEGVAYVQQIQKEFKAKIAELDEEVKQARQAFKETQ